jgi:hypothetical protein
VRLPRRLLPPIVAGMDNIRRPVQFVHYFLPHQAVLELLGLLAPLGLRPVPGVPEEERAEAFLFGIMCLNGI